MSHPQLVEEIRHTPQSTGEKIVIAVFNQLSKEIENKCNKVVSTCMKVTAADLEDRLKAKENLANNNNPYAVGITHNNKVSGVEGVEGVSSKTPNHDAYNDDDARSLAEESGPLGNSNSSSNTNSSILNLLPATVIAYSDPDDCLKILKDRTDGFNQCLEALESLSEFCLPSLVSLLFSWYNEQKDDTRDVRLAANDRAKAENIAKTYQQNSNNNTNTGIFGSRKIDPKVYMAESGTTEKRRNYYHMEHTQIVRRLQTINYYLGIVLIEIMKNIKVHPPGTTMLHKLLNHCFMFFDPAKDLLTASDILIADCKLQSQKNASRRRRAPNNLTLNIADIYAECLGVIGIKHFHELKTKFKHHINDRETVTNHNNDATPEDIEKTVRLIRGLRCIRIVRYPLKELDSHIGFVKEISEKYVEAIRRNQNKEVQQQYAATLVDILIPLSIEINNKTFSEVNVPKVTGLVDYLYPEMLSLAKKNGRRCPSQAFRLVTALLSLSKKEFFLASWHHFLETCLQQLKNNKTSEQKDNKKFCKNVLDCISRLVYVYCLRYSSDSERSGHGNNSALTSVTADPKIAQIFKVLFPTNNKTPIPKDAHVSYFVNLLYYISIKRLEQVMNQIKELLGVNSLGKKHEKANLEKSERMNIGLRSYLYISDALRQKKEIKRLPPIYNMPSGVVRVRESYLKFPMTVEESKTLKLYNHYQKIQSLFEHIIKQLDLNIGKRYMKVIDNFNLSINNVKEVDKSQVVLYETCIGALPVMSAPSISSFYDSDISEILCRAFSQDEGQLNSYNRLQDTAKRAFADFMTHRKTIREDMLVTICNFIIDKVDSNNYILLFQGVRLVENLLTVWVNQAEKDPVLVTKPSNNNNNSIGRTLSEVERQAGFPEIKDGVEPNPDLHGPKSTASYALKRIQSFVVSLMPCWLNFISKEIELASESVVSHSSNSGGGSNEHSSKKKNNYIPSIIHEDSNFLLSLHRILTQCKTLQELLKLKPFNDKLIIDVLDEKFKFLVSSGALSRAIGKTKANYFRHNEQQTLLSFFEYHIGQIKNCAQKARASTAVNHIDSNVDRSHDIYTQYEIFSEVFLLLLKNNILELTTKGEDLFPQSDNSNGTGTINTNNVQMTSSINVIRSNSTNIHNINEHCQQTMLFVWRDLFQRQKNLYKYIQIIISSGAGNNLSLGRKLGTHFASNITTTILKSDRDIDMFSNIWAKNAVIMCAISNRRFNTLNKFTLRASSAESGHSHPSVSGTGVSRLQTPEWLDHMRNSFDEAKIDDNIKNLVETLKSNPVTNNSSNNEINYQKYIDKIKFFAIKALMHLPSDCIHELEDNLEKPSIITLFSDSTQNRKEIPKKNKPKKDLSRIWLVRLITLLAESGTLRDFSFPNTPGSPLKLSNKIKDVIMNCLNIIEEDQNSDKYVITLRYAVAKLFVNMVKFCPTLEIHFELVLKMFNCYKRTLEKEGKTTNFNRGRGWLKSILQNKMY